MRVGVVREIKNGEVRVGMTPAVAAELTAHGHELLVEKGAGEAARFRDELYAEAGATMVADAADVWAAADLLIKVKEPQPEEHHLLRPGLTLFAYLHVASHRELATRLMQSQVTAIAFERVRDDDGYLPLLEPMLEIAGSMGMLMAFNLAASTAGGRGKLPGGVTGITPCRVRILGANPMAYHAARTAAALGADVVMLDPDVRRLQRAARHVPGVRTLVNHPQLVTRAVAEADILVNTFPWQARTPGFLVTREHVRSMKPRALLLDLASDDPGAVETSRPTTFEHPTYVDEGVIHLCIPNMASAAARSATHALANVTQPFLHRIVELGARDALRVDRSLRRGLVTIEGQMVDADTAEWFGVTAVRPEMVLGLER